MKKLLIAAMLALGLGFVMLPRAEAYDIYATTFAGGVFHAGTIYQRATGMPLTTLHDFCQYSGCPDGSFPVGTIVALPDGSLVGVTERGGDGDGGVLYQLTPAADGQWDYHALWKMCFYFEQCEHFGHPKGIAFLALSKDGWPVLMGTEGEKNGRGVLYTITFFSGYQLIDPLVYWGRDHLQMAPSTCVPCLHSLRLGDQRKR